MFSVSKFICADVHLAYYFMFRICYNIKTISISENKENKQLIWLKVDTIHNNVFLILYANLMINILVFN